MIIYPGLTLVTPLFPHVSQSVKLIGMQGGSNKDTTVTVNLMSDGTINWAQIEVKD